MQMNLYKGICGVNIRPMCLRSQIIRYGICHKSASWVAEHACNDAIRSLVGNVLACDGGMKAFAHEALSLLFYFSYHALDLTL